MPRRPRVVLPHVPLHLIQRGNNRQVCFVADDDYRFYLDCLKEFAGNTGCRVHAYVLMTNHVHLLISADGSDAPGALMKALGQENREQTRVSANPLPGENRGLSPIHPITLL